MDGRLPASVKPERYRITLTVDPEAAKFSGEVLIDADLAEPARTITLHALELTIQRAEIDVGGKKIDAKITEDKTTETITLALSSTIPKGKTSLTIIFSGTLNRQLRGLYQARGTIDGREEKYAFTQCEATDARRIFPCFDEPAMKARFQLTAVVPAKLSALSNMPIESDTVEGATRRVRFQETPVMSSYLFALAVARFERVEAVVDGCRLAVVTLPGQLRYADFALEVGAAGLSLLNDYFGLRYPLEKLDLVALPDFAMGAMENWGAIFFRDSRLLVDPTLASTATKRVVANVIVHEIVHQWFGNLVTMPWWDDLWLNEAFATWLAVKIVDQWRPEWNSWVEFQQEKQIPLAIDALEATRPIIAEVTNAAQIEELFDPLTYEKGAAVLRMIEQFLGEEAFRDGIRRYIAAHQHGNAAAADLWGALEAASGQPVGTIAQDWFAQAGYPLIMAGAVADGSIEGGRTIQIEQHRFHIRAAGGVDRTCWSVPVVLTFHDQDGLHADRLLLRQRVETITLPGSGAIDWLYPNGGESGFYRCSVTPPMMEALRSRALGRLAPQERIGLLDNLWALAQAGTLPITVFMEMLVAFRGDRTRVVVQALAGYLETIGDQLVPPAAQHQKDQRPAIAALTADLFTPLWDHYGWGANSAEDDEIRMTRAACLWALGRVARSEPILREAAARFEQWVADPASIDPTLATPLVRLRATTGDAAQFDRYLELFAEAATPEARDRYLLALADFPDPRLARRYLDFSLSDAVRGQDGWKALRFLLAQAAQPAVQMEAWNFLAAHWDAVREKYGSVGTTRIISGLRHVWRREWHEQVRRFFEEPGHRIASAERVLAQTLEFVQIGIAFKERQQAPLVDWLRQFKSGGRCSSPP